MVPAFTLVSDNGNALWGTRMPVFDYDQAVTAIIDSFEFTEVVTSSVTLPTEGLLGATLNWSSSHPEYIATDGTVTRPTAADGDVTVSLTVTVSLDTITETSTFEITVRADSGSGLLAHYAFDNSLSDSNNVFEDASGTGSVYTGSGANIDYVDGVNGSAAILDGTSGIRFPGQLITGNQYTVSLWVNPAADSQFTPTFFAGTDDDSWLSLVPVSWDNNTMLWSNNNGSWFDGTTSEKIPLDTWSHLVFSVNNGDVVVYIDGQAKFTGTDFPDLFTGNPGNFLFGINYFEQDALFEGQVDELRVYDKTLTGDEVFELFSNP